MGGTKKLSKLIVDWENGTRHAKMVQSSGKCASTLHNCISVTDGVKINELNTSIVTGPLYVILNLKRFECSYLRM